MFRLLVFVIALALLPTGLLAGPRIAAPFSGPNASGQPVATVAAETGASATAASSKRCKRGGLPSSACGADIGLPVALAFTTVATVTVGFERSSPMMAGVSPSCLVGPPRSC